METIRKKYICTFPKRKEPNLIFLSSQTSRPPPIHPSISVELELFLARIPISISISISQTRREEEDQIIIMAASLSNFQCHSSSILATIKPKTTSSSSFPQFRISPTSSSLKSQFFGLQLLPPSSVSSSSSSSSFKSTAIYAKVSKGGVPPAFTLKDQDGRNVNLSKFKGKPVVLYFYPADETPGCTKQACAFRDSYEKFKKAGAEVVGISGDNSASHKAFAKKYKLPYTLLSDEGNKIRKEWGVPSDLFGTLPGRQTYVLDKNGVVQLIYNNQFQPEKHIDETLKLLQSL